MNKWLKVLNLAPNNKDGGAGRVARLMIDGPIGGYNWFDESGTTAAQFIRMVDAMDLGEGDEIAIDMNSPGGIVSDGVAITNYLRNHPATVSVNVIGQAGSIASVIAMAADPGRLHMGLGTTMFVHDPAALLLGAYQSDELRKTADMLDKIRDSAVSIYASRNSNLSREDILELMADSTTMTAEEAVEWGFADTMDADLKAVASADMDEVIAQVQARLQAQQQPPQEDPEPDPEGSADPDADPAAAQNAALQIMKLCNDAGVPKLAARFVEQGLTVEQVQGRIESAGQIRDACVAARLPKRADGYIDAGMSLDEVRAELFNVLVKRDEHIDNHPQVPHSGNAPGSAASWDAVFNRIHQSRRI